MNVPESVRTWTELAEDDLLNIENNLAAQQIPWGTVCFHAQQAAEKYLKAALVAKQIAPPRNHDLVELLTLCADAGLSFDDLEDDCFDLTRYAVASRYPGLALSISEVEGHAAAASARRVRNTVRSFLGCPT